MNRTFNISITISRRAARLIAGSLLVIALAVPATVFANHLFSDVPTSSTYHTRISHLVARGITGGCGGGMYCPKDAVTREQMAAFLDRVFEAKGTALGYASVEANGTVSTGYARNLGLVTVAHTLIGYYQVSFGGLTILEDQVIIVQPRQTFGNEVCRVDQGVSGTTAEVFCHTIDVGSPAVNIAFNVLVMN